jgi:hypothetical protein
VRLVTLDEKNPEKFTHELKRFKQFGLKCESLGPILRNFTDRQSLFMHIAGYAAGGIAGITAIAFLIKFLTEKFGG